MEGATPFISMISPRAETGRTQSGTLLRNEVKQMRGATGLTVLALFLRASLLCAATCELTSKCKQSAKEWSATKWSGMSELSVCYLFGRSVSWNTRNVESGSGTKYGWSERQLTNSIWNSELDSELDSKPILMGDTQNHSVWLRVNNTLRYKYLFRKR